MLPRIEIYAFDKLSAPEMVDPETEQVIAPVVPNGNIIKIKFCLRFVHLMDNQSRNSPHDLIAPIHIIIQAAFIKMPPEGLKSSAAHQTANAVELFLHPACQSAPDYEDRFLAQP